MNNIVKRIKFKYLIGPYFKVNNYFQIKINTYD